MTYHNFTEDVHKIIDNAGKSIIFMFKQRKVKEIEFQIPLSFTVASDGGSKLMRFPKIIFTDNKALIIYLVDESGFTHSLYELVNKIDICKIYDSVYKYFHENVNVKHI